MKKIIEAIIAIILLIVLIFIGKSKLAVLYYNRGNDCYERGLYKEAIANFNKSLKMNPSIAMVHYGLANAYLEKKLEDKAREEYEKTIQIDPAFIWGYKALTHLYLLHESYEEALILLRQAQIVVPDNQEIKKLLEDVSFEYMSDYLDKGVNAFLSGDKSKAYSLLNKALEIKPDFTFSHYSLAFFYYADSRYNEAEAELREALKRDSNFWSAYKLLGEIYFEKGLYEEAIYNYKRALSLNATDPTIYNNLGLALMNIESYNEAATYLKEALRLNSRNINIHYSLANVYRDTGRLDEAMSAYKEIITHQFDYPNVHNDLADIYICRKQNKEALEEYQKEIEYSRARLSRNPKDVVTLNNMAYAYNGIGESKKAEELIAQVLNYRPDYRQAHLTLAKIYEKSGQLDKSLVSLEKAKSLSKETQFIDRDIDRINEELERVFKEKKARYSLDTIYLKNGRQLKGVIKTETEDKITLEVSAGGSIGTVTLSRDNIGRIVRDAYDALSTK